MTKKQRKFKKGAAAYYIVAFSTLILVIIATSFALVMLSEARRSSNDELSQSAYDAALVGVEDAKLAFSNYQRCVASGATAAKLADANAAYSTSSSTGAKTYTVNCPNIMAWVQNKNLDCSTVAKVLGRPISANSNEVDIGGVSVGDGSNTSTNQAYACTTIDVNLSDYRSTLTSTKKRQTMRIQIGNGTYNNATEMRINWYSVRSDNKISSTTTKNFDESSNHKVEFGTLTSGNGVSVPPTLEVQIVQTGGSFSLASFDKVKDNTTNRATVYLVPTTSETYASKNNSGSDIWTNSRTYIGAWTGSKNVVKKSWVAKTNDHSASNKPFLVYCDKNTDKEYYCSATIKLPNAYNRGDDKRRNNKTFMVSVALPYQQPDTDFSLEFFCDGSDTKCGNGSEEVSVSGGTQVNLKNTQVAIDSTGRANDLYRRIETRLEASDTNFGTDFPNYALEVLTANGIKKKMKVKHEQKSGDDPAGFYF